MQLRELKSTVSFAVILVVSVILVVTLLYFLFFYFVKPGTSSFSLGYCDQAIREACAQFDQTLSGDVMLKNNIIGCIKTYYGCYWVGKYILYCYECGGCSNLELDSAVNGFCHVFESRGIKTCENPIGKVNCGGGGLPPCPPNQICPMPI